MSVILLACLFAIIVPNTRATVNSGCRFQMSLDVPDIEPLYLIQSAKGRLEFFIPKQDFNMVQAGSQLLLSCTGKNNRFQGKKEHNLIALQCLNGTFYTREGERVYLKELSCEIIPTSEIVNSGEFCSDGLGHILKIGFDVGKQFVSSYSVCHDTRNHTTFYSASVVNGAVDRRIGYKGRKLFRDDGMNLPSGYVNDLYKQTNVLSVFERLFGKDQQFIVPKEMFIARGHLAPDGDFIFRYLEMASYFLTNVGPEFQSVNCGHWNRVENKVREKATQLKSDLVVHTGYMGTLQLLNAHINKLVPVHLDDRNGFFPVPEFYYKVVQHEANDSAIVFVTSNNPFAAKAEDVRKICHDVCSEARIDINTYDKNGRVFFSKGYTICCTLNEFQKVYRFLPPTLKASKLLIFDDLLSKYTVISALKPNKMAANGRKI